MTLWRITAAAVLATATLNSPALADDRDTLTAFLEDNLSSAGRVVTITGFQGALSSQATIQELTIADDAGVWLTLDGVTLDWNRAALLGGVLVVNKLTADDIRLDRLPQSAPSAAPTPEAQAFALPVLPVSVTLGEISAKHIALGSGVLGEAVEGTATADASLLNGQGHIRLGLDRSGDTKGHFSLIAVYANDTNELTLALDAEEAAGGLAVKAMGVPGAPAAHLIIGGKGPLQGFAANLRLDTDGQTRLSGKVALTGAGEGATDFAADVSGDLSSLFLPEYAAFFGPKVALQAKGRHSADGTLDIGQIGLTAAALNLTGAVTVAADGLPSRVNISGTMGLPDGSPLLLPLTGTPTRIASADLSIGYDQSAGEDWTADLTAKGLSRSDFAAGQISLAGTGHVRHDGVKGLSAALNFAAKDLQPTDPALATAIGPEAKGTLTLDWASGTGKLDITRVSLSAGDARLATTGKIGGLETGFRLDGSLNLVAADLRRFAPLAGRPLAGAAKLALTGWISPLSGQFDADVTMTGRDLHSGMAQVDGLLAGLSDIGLSGRRDEAGTALRRLVIKTDALDADLSGQVATAGSDLSGTVALADLAALNLGVSGGLSAKARFTGTLDAGHLTLTGQGQDLAMGQAQADALAAGQTVLDLDLNLTGTTVQIAKADISGPALHLAATGRYDPSGSALAGTVDLPNLSVLKPGWGGALSGKVTLDGPLQAAKLGVTATSTNLRIGQSQTDRLIGGQGRLTAALQMDGSRLKIDGLDFATPALTVKASGVPEALDIQARLANLALILPEFPGALTANGTLQQTAAGTALDLKVQGPGQIAANLAGTISSDFGTANLTAKGTAQAGLANMLIAPRLVAGATRFDLALRGPFALSSISGTASISDGRLADPAQSFSLVGINGTARLSGGGADVSVDSALNTGGSVKVTGRIGLTPPMPANLNIQVNGAILRDPNLYQTKLSGGLTFIGPALGGAEVAGTITLAKTELRIPSTGFGSLPVLDDLRHQSDSAAVRATRVRAGLEGASARGQTGGGGYRLNLTVLAPNQVFIRGRGLDAELGGSVRLGGTTAAIVPSGALSLIRGRLDLLGKRLTLSDATLQMQGALVPYIHIAATTSSDGFDVSTVVEGDALNPVVTFTSTPDLPQEEVLARLLFDKGLQNLSAFQAAQLAGAVASLAGKGGEGVIGRLRKSAGLDNLDVQSDGTGNTSVTAGKYLSKKVYTEVTVDQSGKSTVNLNLDVSKHITLRGKLESDGQTGIGVYLEKDY